MEWLRKYFADLSQMDRESDSFRYPFHIVWELDEWEWESKFAIKPANKIKAKLKNIENFIQVEN